MANAHRLLKALTRLEAGLAALAYSTVVLILFTEVVAVDVFSAALRGSQQAAVLSGIVACMLGLTLATSFGAHFRPTVADRIIPYAWADRVGDAISSVLFLVLFAVSVQFVLQSYIFSDRVPMLDIPLWPVQVIVPYVMASCALKHAVFAVSPDIKEALSDRVQ